MTGRQLADRVMKARRCPTCPACRGPITPGQQIGRCKVGGMWVHLWCLLEHQHDEDTEDSDSG
jgi:hypothetical protein